MFMTFIVMCTVVAFNTIIWQACTRKASSIVISKKRLFEHNLIYELYIQTKTLI